MLSDDEKKRLDEIFYGKDLMMKGFKVFRNSTKHLDIPSSKLRYYYENQEIVQVFKPIIPKRKVVYVPITAKYPFERVYFDTMFITGLNITLINAVDLFSKYGFSKIFRGGVVDSKKSTEALETFLRNVIELGYYITSIRCDKGSEFMGTFKTTCDDLGIDLKYTDAKDKKQTSPIESFNRTIRLQIEKLRLLLSNVNPVVPQLEKAIYDITKSYNETPHASTDYTPYEILKDEYKQNEVLVETIMKKAQKLDEYKNLQSGDNVRIQKENGPFTKLSPNWSKQLYTIKGFDIRRNRYTLHERDGFFEPSKLQYVNEKTLMKGSIDRYITENNDDDEPIRPKSNNDVDVSTILEGKRIRKPKARDDSFIWD